EASRRMLGRRRLSFEPPIIQAMMGMPAPRALAIFREYYRLPESVDELMKERSAVFYQVLGQEPAPLMFGVVPLLARLDQTGMPKAIATSSSRRYVKYILAPHAIAERFGFVLTCDDVRQGKPAPEIYEKAAERFAVPTDRMLVLEDSVNGLRAAKAA